MIINIPNYKNLNINYLVLDYNGTIASGGLPLDIQNTLFEISKQLKIVVLSGNTFSGIEKHLEDFEVEVVIAKDAEAKRQYLEDLNPDLCIAIGNGNIDGEMLASAGLGIAVIGDEGCATAAILKADLLVKSIHHAFEMILDPTKLIATLKR